MTNLSAKCPNCSAILTVDPQTDYTRCNYCSAYVKVRDSLVIKFDTDNPNLLEVAQIFLESGNLTEANHYVNKVIESAPDNYTAWKIKSMITFSAAALLNGDETLLTQALYYAVKSINLAPYNEKPKLKEEFSDKIISLNSELIYTDFLETARGELNTDKLLVHLIDVYINSLYRKKAFGENCPEDFKNRLNSLIGQLRQSDTNTAEQKMNEFKLRDIEAMAYRKKYLKKIFNRHFTNGFGKWLVYSLIIISILGIIFSMGSFEMCIASFIVLFIISYVLFHISIRAKTSRDERRIYGDVLVYR